jgi:hypothetical protein
LSDNPEPLPPGYKHWPPTDCEAFLREIETGWAKENGRRGKHWGLQVTGNNPISGYRVVYKKLSPGDP